MVLLTIWPLFALICLGYLLAKRGFPRPDFWDAAEKLTYFILFPALLVRSLSNAPVRDPEILKLGGAAVVSILLAVAAMALARRARPLGAARFGPAVQGVIRFNTYLGLAITAALAGDPGLERAAVYLAIAVPVTVTRCRVNGVLTPELSLAVSSVRSLVAVETSAVTVGFWSRLDSSIPPRSTNDTGPSKCWRNCVSI